MNSDLVNLTCNTCGAPLRLNSDRTLGCEYCGNSYFSSNIYDHLIKTTFSDPMLAGRLEIYSGSSGSPECYSGSPGRYRERGGWRR